MRLTDMNSLNSRQLNENMNRQVGWNFKNLNKLSIAQASAMLESVTGKIYSVKNSKQLHESQNRSDYNALMLSKKVLETYIAEKAKSDAQRKAIHANKKKTNEGKERPYVAVHAKKGKTEVTADSSYGAAKKAAEKWKMKSTAGIDVYLADVTHIATEGKDGINEISSDLARRYKKNAKVDRDNTDHILKRDGSSNDWKTNKELHRRNAKRTKGINRADKRIANEGYSYAEQQVDDTFESIMDRLLKMAKVLREDSALAKSVDSIGGDPLAMRDAYQGVLSAYDDVSEAHYAAMGHIVDESKAQGVFEDEIGQAESIMAAQDMVDKVQAMLEDVGEMINEQLPPLTDNLRKSNSADRAAQFNSTASSALNSLMDAVRSARESMSSAVAGLSGEQVEPMSTPDADFDVDADDVDLDVDATGDDFDASAPAAGGDEPLGRSKRED